MAGATLHGTCQVCKTFGDLIVTYFHYNIECTCCSGNHFDRIAHHPGCKPSRPKETRLWMDTSKIKPIK